MKTIKSMAIDPNNVRRVYSGGQGCMCGCQGIYRIPSALREEETAERGYEHEDEEVSDRAVKSMVTRMNRMFDDPVPGMEAVIEGDYVAIEYTTEGGTDRQYVAYLR